jgi:serine/threonine protein kinase
VSESPCDLTATLFILPPDAKILPISELSARVRAKIGPVEDGQSVITRQGFRVTTRLVPGPLAELLGEFRAPSLVTDAVLRFARARDQNPAAVLELAIDALSTLIEVRILVPKDSPEAAAPTPTLGAGQEFAGFEIEALIRSLEDSEVYRVSGRDGETVALKIARNDRPVTAAMLANEARILERLGGGDTPRLLEHGTERGRRYVAMQWSDGVSIAFAAQKARAARDRPRLHALVSRMLEAYGRLHEKGVLHGDIHPGNCLARDDGSIMILDFGTSRLIGTGPSAVDPARTGIPHFYDPQMAGALLARQLPPAATPESEQYSIAALAYLLLTGLHPIEAPAVQDEMLRRIAERPPLPFPARGVAAWPEVEAVLRRGLAREPDRRFPDVSEMARAFASADVPQLVLVRSARAQRAFEVAVETVRSLLPPCAEFPLDYAWFGLRAAMAMDDAELLAAADVLAGWAGSGWAAQSVAAHIASVRSDSRMESKAISGFLTSAESLPDGPEAAAAILAAFSVLEGGALRSADTVALASWARDRLDRLKQVAEPLLIYAELSLCRTGVIAVRPDLATRLDAMAKKQVSDVWLWSLAHDVLSEDRFNALALGAALPSRPLWRGFCLLRLHQLTGDKRWTADANRMVTRAPNARLPELETALLMAELKAPERAIPLPFLLPPSLSMLQ